MQSQTSKIFLAVIITAIVVGSGVYFWPTQVPKQQNMGVKIFSFNQDDSFSFQYPAVWKGESSSSPEMGFTKVTVSSPDWNRLEKKGAELVVWVNRPDTGYEYLLKELGSGYEDFVKELGGHRVSTGMKVDAKSFAIDKKTLFGDKLGNKYTILKWDIGNNNKVNNSYIIKYEFFADNVSERRNYDAVLENLINTFNWQIRNSTGITDLEKIIVREKDELFRTYDETSKELSRGYPVIFSNTTNPAVRFTSLSNSGGDGSHKTQYFINQSEQKILQVDTDEYGGDFGASGNLTLALNGGSVDVISREQVVNSEKREIEYNGLRVNNEMSYTFIDAPIIFKPVSALKFEVLGVSPDLTQIYFTDEIKGFSYDIVTDKIQEIAKFPAAMAKPITN